MPSQGIIRCPVEAVWNGRPGTAPCVSSKYNNCRENDFLPDSFFMQIWTVIPILHKNCNQIICAVSRAYTPVSCRILFGQVC